MATSPICLDTTILIDFFRKGNKANSILFQIRQQYKFFVSAITIFEVQIGLKSVWQQQQYQTLIENIEVFTLDLPCIETAVEVYGLLKSQNAQIELADLLIGATALHHKLPLATLNTKHFERIPTLQLVNFR